MKCSSLRSCFLLAGLFATLQAVAQPATGRDTLPLSYIDIPIRINLRPLFALAESSVDTVFTSPGYPEGWVQADCATRYKYRFRRSPLRMTARGNTLQLGFTGLYRIIGSTRLCAGGTVLSPWAPECKCGFDEGERKVDVSFLASFQLRPDHSLLTRIVRPEPRALDKCEVCFWGQDITGTVMDGLKQELDASKKALEDSFGRVDLRPYMQLAWNKLSEVYSIPNAGYFSLRPKSLRMQNLGAQNDLLDLRVGLSASPAITFHKPDGLVTPVPPLSTAAAPEGFSIYLEAALEYDSLSRVLNGFMAGKRFEISEGFIKKHIIIDSCRVYAGGNNLLAIEASFSGSHKGIFYLTGTPVYNEAGKRIEVAGLEYDLRTRDFLLKTAKWLFNKQIINEIRKYAAFDLSTYYETAAASINTWLNREWVKGISGQGSVGALSLVAVEAQPGHLYLRTHCVGRLSIQVNEIGFSL